MSPRRPSTTGRSGCGATTTPDLADALREIRHVLEDEPHRLVPQVGSNCEFLVRFLQDGSPERVSTPVAYLQEMNFRTSDQRKFALRPMSKVAGLDERAAIDV
jgi:hypothetical protein